MFIIGMIVGMIIGAIATSPGIVWFTQKITGMSIDEMEDCGNLMIEAGANRESAIVIYHDDAELNRVTLKEK